MKKNIFLHIKSVYITSMFFLAILIYFDIQIVMAIANDEVLDDKLKLISFFINILFLLIISLPAINHLISKLDSKSIDNFLNLPERDAKLTYVHFYDFLSGMALSGFYISITIFTFKGIYTSFGWFIAAFYLALMYIFSISLSAFSLVRFLHPFTRFRMLPYMFCGISSCVVMLAVIEVSMKMIN